MAFPASRPLDRAALAPSVEVPADCFPEQALPATGSSIAPIGGTAAAAVGAGAILAVTTRRRRRSRPA